MAIICCKNDLFSKFIVLLKEDKKRCKESMDWCKLRANKTCEEAIIDDYVKDKNAPDGWGEWCLLALYDNLDSELRLAFMGRLSPPVAFHCFIEMKHLTDEEEQVLRVIFKGQLPPSEKKLSDGLIIRKKE